LNKNDFEVIIIIYDSPYFILGLKLLTYNFILLKKYMKTISYLLIISFLIFSCKNEKNKENIKPSALIIGDPLECGIQNILIFPVGTSYSATVYEKMDQRELSTRNILYFAKNSTLQNDKSAEVEYINEKEKDFDIRNILFYNLLTGKSKQLISDTIHILSFAIHKEFEKPLIFYRIVKKDINNDRKYNSDDPVILYVSSLNGDSLVQVTPTVEHFIDYNYYAKSKILLIKTLIDSDNDKNFSNKDETNFLEMKITKPAFGKEIFSRALKDSLRNQIILK
jgi:hypothetical protein